MKTRRVSIHRARSFAYVPNDEDCQYTAGCWFMYFYTIHLGSALYLLRRCTVAGCCFVLLLFVNIIQIDDDWQLEARDPSANALRSELTIKAMVIALYDHPFHRSIRPAFPLHAAKPPLYCRCLCCLLELSSLASGDTFAHYPIIEIHIGIICDR